MNYKKPQSTLVQGGTGIYPLTTADQVILADGSRLEKDGRISADSAANSAKLGGKAPEYYIQPRNLLDNSDFRNPVNQRGITNVSTTGYCIDRWIFSLSGSGALSVQDGLLAFNASNESYCEIVQIQENSSALSGKEMTFVVCIAPDNIICLNFTYGTNASVLSADGNIALIHYNGDRVYIRIFSTGNNWIGVKWAALYEGSYTADTLPPYVPKGYTAELAECQRYYYQSFSGSIVSEVDGTIIREAVSPYRIADVSFPQAMRIDKPTITLYSPISGNVGKISEYLSDTDIDAQAGYRSRYRFQLVCTTSVFEAGKHYYMHYTVSADL